MLDCGLLDGSRLFIEVEHRPTGRKPKVVRVEYELQTDQDGSLLLVKDDGELYRVALAPWGLSCTCKDKIYRHRESSDGGPVGDCKHKFAARRLGLI